MKLLLSTKNSIRSLSGRIIDIWHVGSILLVVKILINKVLLVLLGFKIVCVFQKEANVRFVNYHDCKMELYHLHKDEMDELYQMENSDISNRDKDYFDKSSEYIDCYVSKLNGRITGYYFVNNRLLDVPEVNIKLRLPPLTFYIFKCFVFRGYRKRGIYTAALLRINRLKFQNNFRASFICASPTNIAAIKGNERVGFRKIGRCWTIQKGPFRKSFNNFERRCLNLL